MSSVPANSTSEQTFAFDEVNSLLDSCVAMKEGRRVSNDTSLLVRCLHLNSLPEESSIHYVNVFMVCNYHDIITVPSGMGDYA